MEIVTRDNIKDILLAGESNTVEFKARASSAVHVLPRLISAFANTEGGIIIVGYDEMHQSVVGTSSSEFERINKVIAANELEDVCNAYVIPYEDKTLIIIQVMKSNSVVIAGGGAYVRKWDSTVSTLSGTDVVKRITSTVKAAESTSSEETLNRLERKLEQIYDEMLRSQKVHEEELEEQKKEHAKEAIHSRRSNWFFCILSALIGYALAKIF